MKKEIIFYTIIGLLAGTLIGTYSTGAVGNNKNTMGRASMADMDQHFIEQMIPHHNDAITMAKLAQSTAKRPEIKQLANNIIVSQSKENRLMKSWYKNWYGKDVPEDSEAMGGMMNSGGMRGGMRMGMMGDETDMSRLENASDFDKAFIEEMIPHHQMAVMMANMLVQNTSRPEMKKLAGDIIDAQTKEIDAMRGWYKEWGY